MASHLKWAHGLGIYFYGFQQYPSSRRDPELAPGYYPEKPLLNVNEWQAIIDYYTSLSPDSLGKQERIHAPKMSSSLFTVEAPPPGRLDPNTCLLRMDTHQIQSNYLRPIRAPIRSIAMTQSSSLSIPVLTRITSDQYCKG